MTGRWSDGSGTEAGDQGRCVKSPTRLHNTPLHVVVVEIVAVVVAVAVQDRKREKPMGSSRQVVGI